MDEGRFRKWQQWSLHIGGQALTVFWQLGQVRVFCCRSAFVSTLSIPSWHQPFQLESMSNLSGYIPLLIVINVTPVPAMTYRSQLFWLDSIGFVHY